MSLKVKSVAEAVQIFNEKMKQLGEIPWGTTEISDLNIDGSETVKFIEDLANDIHSELQSDRAEARHAAWNNDFDN